MFATLKNKITEEMKAAMKQQDKKRLAVIRLVLAQIKQVEIDERIDVDDQRVINILDKMRKQCHDSKEQFISASRDDLVEQMIYEITTLEEFLPSKLTADKIETLILSAIAETSAATIKDMGQVMARLKPKVIGRVDMSEVSSMVRKYLG